jgi:hypothetical protein
VLSDPFIVTYTG